MTESKNKPAYEKRGGVHTLFTEKHPIFNSAENGNFR
jgi:hypothetical protein